MEYFLEDAENFAQAVVVGPRISEVGFLSPVKVMAVTKELKVATVLSNILRRKSKESHFDCEVANLQVL